MELGTSFTPNEEKWTCEIPQWLGRSDSYSLMFIPPYFPCTTTARKVLIKGFY